MDLQNVTLSKELYDLFSEVLILAERYAALEERAEFRKSEKERIWFAYQAKKQAFVQCLITLEQEVLKQEKPKDS